MTLQVVIAKNTVPAESLDAWQGRGEWRIALAILGKMEEEAGVTECRGLNNYQCCLEVYVSLPFLYYYVGSMQPQYW